jgi:cytochrome bd-type quinol oxidase subunit 1
MPVAVKVAGTVTLETDSVDVLMPKIVALAGIDSNTVEGTVKVPAEVGALQENSPTTKSVVLLPISPKDKPEMVTKVFASPPVQLTLSPLARVIVEVLLMFVQVRGDAKFSVAVNAPTSGPPEPLSNVNVPPEAGMNEPALLGVV